MFPSKNPDFPDALVRRLKDPNKARSARKSAAAAAAAATAAGAGEVEGEPEAEEATSVKKAKAKPKPRKSAVAGDVEPTAGVTHTAVEMDGVQKTLAERAAKVTRVFASSEAHHG